MDFLLNKTSNAFKKHFSLKGWYFNCIDLKVQILLFVNFIFANLHLKLTLTP